MVFVIPTNPTYGLGTDHSGDSRLGSWIGTIGVAFDRNRRQNSERTIRPTEKGGCDDLKQSRIAAQGSHLNMCERTRRQRGMCYFMAFSGHTLPEIRPQCLVVRHLKR